MGDVRVIHLTEQLPEEYVFDNIRGQLLDDDSYDLLLDEDADVYKPNGELLMKLRKKVLPASVLEPAYRALRDAATWTDNRGMAAGPMEVKPGEHVPDPVGGNRVAATSDGRRYKAIKRDGTVDSTTRAKNVESGIIGYFDRNARFPYCRQTAFNVNQPDKFAAAYPYIRAVDDVFRQLVPDRYAAQKAIVEATNPDFVISNTVFTTVTVNRNWQTAVHQDAGDLRAGFGVLGAFSGGKYTGCYFVFPAFRVAANLRTGDVLCADVHEWHGNSPFYGRKGQYERVSTVLYYRERMAECGSAADEGERAKRRQRGDKIHG